MSIEDDLFEHKGYQKFKSRVVELVHESFSEDACELQSIIKALQETIVLLCDLKLEDEKDE